jgi:hypothetical protein
MNIMNKLLCATVLTVALSAAPSFVRAETQPVFNATFNTTYVRGTVDGGAGYGQGVPVTDATSLFAKLNSIGNAITVMLIALAVIYIVWNTVKFIMQTDSAERATYRSAIMWGIVGLFVILSIWGLVNILGQTFGVGNSLNGNRGQASNDVNSLILTK